MKRFSILVLVLVLMTATLASCGLLADQCEHTYSDKWEVDDNNHWHKATCDHTDLISSKGGHVDENNDGACDMCGHGEVHMHTYTDAWTSDANGHWHLATCDGHTTVKGDVYAHKNADNDADCDLCGYVLQWTLAVDADEAVDVADAVYASKDTGKVTFEAKVSDEFILHVTGATQKGEAVVADGVATYTYEVADVAADGEVAIAAERVVYASKLEENTKTVTFEEGSARETLTFDLPAGTYALAGEGEGLSIYFMDEYYSSMDTFTLERAGEVEVNVVIYDFSETMEDADYTYTLYSIPTVEIDMPALEGDGYVLPAKQPMALKFVAPEAGLYYVSSTVEEIYWNDNLAPCVVYAEEAGDIISVDAYYYSDDTAATYEIDWKVEKLEATETLAEGDNEIDITYRGITAVKLVAAENALYTIDFSAITEGTNVKVFGLNYYDEYDLVDAYDSYETTVLSQLLDEGESIVFYFYNTDESAYADSDVVTDTVSVESTAVVAFGDAIEISYENSYMFSFMWEPAQVFSFTAPAAGIYTIYAPEGLGFWSKASYDNGDWDAEISAYGGTPVSFELAENEVLEFYVMAIEAGTYQIQYTYTEAEVGGGDDNQGGEPASTVFVVGENTGVCEGMAQMMNGAEYTFTPAVSGTYTITNGDNVSYIMIGNSPIAGTVELTAGEPVIFRVFVNAPGEFTVTITAPEA